MSCATVYDASTDRSVATPMSGVAKRYAREHGMTIPAVDFSTVISDGVTGYRIAAAYGQLPVYDPAALPAYRAFAFEVDAQYAFLTDRVGLRVEFVDVDPYPGAGDCPEINDVLRDLRSNHLYVWRTDAGSNPHPVLTTAQNDRFRAVHDALGHGVAGRGFDRHSEEAAWLAHSMLFSPLARLALTTETRGQNCTLIYGPGDGFPVQKAALLPTWCAELRYWSRLSARD